MFQFISASWSPAFKLSQLVNHVAKLYVVEIVLPTNFGIKLFKQQHELPAANQTPKVQFAKNSVELGTGYCTIMHPIVIFKQWKKLNATLANLKVGICEARLQIILDKL